MQNVWTLTAVNPKRSNKNASLWPETHNFRSNPNGVMRTIWFSNWNFRVFHLNGKHPWLPPIFFLDFNNTCQDPFFFFHISIWFSNWNFRVFHVNGKHPWLPPIFFLDFNNTCQDRFFFFFVPHIHKPSKNTFELADTMLKKSELHWPSRCGWQKEAPSLILTSN